jgi:hypothetical protein
MTASALRGRAQELGLDDEQAAAWEERVEPDVVDAVLANLIRFEDALRELSR